MLTFIGGNDARLELDVIGYQFQNADLDGWDSEWLIVAGTVSCEQGKWKFRDPCLTTFELQALAKWLRTAANNASAEIGFTEPNLSFARAGAANAEQLTISFAQECAPPWATDHEKYGNGFSLGFPIALIDCAALADDIDKILGQFPARAFPKGFPSGANAQQE